MIADNGATRDGCCAVCRTALHRVDRVGGITLEAIARARWGFHTRGQHWRWTTLCLVAHTNARAKDVSHGGVTAERRRAASESHPRRVLDKERVDWSCDSPTRRVVVCGVRPVGCVVRRELLHERVDVNKRYVFDATDSGRIVATQPRDEESVLAHRGEIFN